MGGDEDGAPGIIRRMSVRNIQEEQKQSPILMTQNDADQN